jgi:uncharacterized protein (TIGR04168 family)
MSSELRIAVIGDVHLRFSDDDVAWFNESGYDQLLFVGDLAGYAHQGALDVARRVARLELPTLVIPGNHDAVRLAHLAAEVVRRPRLARVLGVGQNRLCNELADALSPVPLCGYSRHELKLRGQGVSLVAARPHSMGGSYLSFESHIRHRFGVSSIEHSAARLCQLVDACESERMIFLAHNGPSGLGSGRADIWGCDFRKEEGDFGDEDLRLAVEHARASGRRVLAVLAGHMHHAIKGGGERCWQLEREGVLYINAARVPRIFERDGRRVRHHVVVTLFTDNARAEAVLVDEAA